MRSLAGARNDMAIRWLWGSRSGDSCKQLSNKSAMHLRIATSAPLVLLKDFVIPSASEGSPTYSRSIKINKFKNKIMKTFKSILILSLMTFLIFGFGLSGEMPKGWFKSGSIPDSYKFGTDSIVFKNGKKSVSIESLDKNIEGFATIMQICNAKNYLGTRIKMTGYIKSENVSDWAGMWLRIDSKTPNESLGFDNMQDRPITGNSDWTKCEIVLDVPEESGTLNFGALISGTGKIWFDNISFEILDNNIPKISKDSSEMPVPEKPENLDFEE